MSNNTREDKAIERMAKRDRSMPSVPGLGGGYLSGDMGTGVLRLKDTVDASKTGAHVATGHKRVKPRATSGALPQVVTGMKREGTDDGTDYFTEWRSKGGVFGLPKAKTKAQDKLTAMCVAWIAGEREGSRDAIKSAIKGIESTDLKHGRSWHLAMSAQGLYTE